MKTIKHILFIAVSAFTLMSCGNEIPSDFDYGKVENNKYTNDFFGLTMNIPEGWYLQDNQTQNELAKMGADALNNEKLSKVIDAAEITTANLVTASQFDIATHTDPNVPNSSFNLIAENLGMASLTVKDGKDYLNASRKLFIDNNMPIVVKEETESIEIDGKIFYYFDAILNTQGEKIKQRYIATVMNGFALLYAPTYSTDDQLKKLMEVLKTADFK